MVTHFHNKNLSRALCRFGTVLTLLMYDGLSHIGRSMDTEVVEVISSNGHWTDIGLYSCLSASSLTLDAILNLGFLQDLHVLGRSNISNKDLCLLLSRPST